MVTGVDGVDRRWVYLHYFKEGQPSINWLDPSFAGMRLVIGDALHALADLGSGGLRLDANGFLGVEKTAEDEPAWSEGHPLSRGRQPPDREHDPQDGRLLLPGAQPRDGRHQDDGRVRRRPVLRLRQPPRLPPRAGHRRHRVPAADAEHRRGAWASTPPRSCTRCRTTTSSPTSSCTSPPATATTCSPSAARRSRGGELAEHVRQTSTRA